MPYTNNSYGFITNLNPAENDCIFDPGKFSIYRKTVGDLYSQFPLMLICYKMLEFATSFFFNILVLNTEQYLSGF